MSITEKIGIIGGGISGLSAAWHLSKDSEVVLFEKNSYLDVIVLCNVNSNTQMVSSVKKLKELVKSKNKNFFSEGLDSSWALVEFEGVGIHFFTEEAREYYNLEDLFFDSNLVNQYG